MKMNETDFWRNAKSQTSTDHLTKSLLESDPFIMNETNKLHNRMKLHKKETFEDHALREKLKTMVFDINIKYAMLFF